MKTIVSTANAPGAIGPYSQAVSGAGTLVFVSGQLPVNPETGTMPEGISAQTEQSPEFTGRGKLEAAPAVALRLILP